MARLIDADDLKDLMFVALMSYERGFISIIENVINDCPTVDAVEVVRCKDCKFYETKHYYKGICKNIIGMVDVQDGNSFCSYGERKEETE